MRIVIYLQNAGQNNDLLILNKFFKIVAGFKYWAMTLKKR